MKIPHTTLDNHFPIVHAENIYNQGVGFYSDKEGVWYWWGSVMYGEVWGCPALCRGFAGWVACPMPTARHVFAKRLVKARPMRLCPVPSFAN